MSRAERRPSPTRRRPGAAAVLSGLLLVTACSSAGGAPAAPTDWRPAAPMAVARQELYPEVWNDRVYVAGGLLNPNTGASAHFDAYDPATDTWQQLATLPDARHHIGLAAAAGRIYAVGGFSGGFPRWQAQADAYVFDPAQNRWSPGVALPAPRAEFTVEGVGDRVYVIGGRVRATPDASSFTTHVDTTATEVFDPATGAWSTRAPAPTARNSAASVVVGEEVYVLGGRRFSLAADGSAVQTNLATVEVYDTRTDTWRTGPPMPAGRGGLAAAVHDGAVYVFGGEQMGAEGRVFSEVWRLDAAAGTWTTVGQLPTPRHGLGAATVADTIYTFGGGTRPGGGFASDRTEALDLG